VGAVPALEEVDGDADALSHPKEVAELIRTAIAGSL
jgi:hypothetical protein